MYYSILKFTHEEFPLTNMLKSSITIMFIGKIVFRKLEDLIFFLKLSKKGIKSFSHCNYTFYL
jgi:hypothetical protein